METNGTKKAMSVGESELFAEFLAFSSAKVTKSEAPSLPPALKRKLLSELHPSAFSVFGRLFAIHLIVGLLSLLLCDQFGMNPFGTSFSLSKYFMAFGHSVCMFLCGVLFLSLTLLAAALVLSLEDLRVIRKSAWLQIFVLSGVSLGVFGALGAEVASLVGLLWVLGALLGGKLFQHWVWTRVAPQ